MYTVNEAVTVLEELYLDEFKSSHLDKEARPNIILDIHSLFKYQSRIYSFADGSLIKMLYGALRTGSVSNSNQIDTDDVSYPLNFLTEISQRLVTKLFRGDGEISYVINDLSIELASTFTMHGKEQKLITDMMYQGVITVDGWVEILNNNPWLVVASLLKYTSYDLTEALYNHHAQAKDLRRG